jgi:hypothetical protein
MYAGRWGRSPCAATTEGRRVQSGCASAGAQPARMRQTNCVSIERPCLAPATFA